MPADGAAQPRVAVVTGAARGLGRVIALHLGRTGFAVAVAARDRVAAQVVAAEIAAAGGMAEAFGVDVTDEGAVGALADAVGAWGSVHTVVANAGIAGPTGLMHELSLSDWRATTAADLDSVFLTFRAFIPVLIGRGSGSLVAISSMTGKRPLHGRTPYAAAKMGVIGLVRTLATELGPHGVRVNSVCPGGISGERIDAVIRLQAQARGIPEAEARSSFTASSPMDRLVTPEEVADVCAFLASDQSTSITGEDLNVSAGVVMY